MKITATKSLLLIALAAGLMTWFWAGNNSPRDNKSGNNSNKVRNIPVEVRPVEVGSIDLRRTFSGALEPRAEFIVAPKVAGRVEQLSVNISDAVKRDQIVGALDNDEYVQLVDQARATLAVAKANLAEARSAEGIANRELKRIKTLQQRGVASESQLDVATANQLTNKVKVEVAKAEVSYAESALETALTRLGYTQITAGWSGGNGQRIVAERYVDEGEMVAVNTPLLRIVELDPMTGVVFVAERDYGLLQPGQKAVLTTDAFPNEEFLGQIERIAPIFKQATRQARVELTIDNPQQRLKPGMFIRATVVLDQKTNVTIVPEQSLATRDNQTGIFLVNADGSSVQWHQVIVGIRDGDRVEVSGENITGQVVTLGQHMLDDNATISIPSDQSLKTGQKDSR
ncbi:RND family efflux transporter, MFP subunit [Desulfuromusa kysingii]|uniref:RND family efflux transporter, MFP subunit n=1 Tax=Desulfuromusa kysingii TaxID=37625 RepID=A0A1H3W2W9_9BACT|nr:efflux RND transporter periplasmic adaptor subunit [Desulfuromusa kysingii]SDZ80668.1 RND family efflux transporter, MFP subunit [Desulfuromusa kysingii]